MDEKKITLAERLDLRARSRGGFPSSARVSGVGEAPSKLASREPSGSSRARPAALGEAGRVGIDGDEQSADEDAPVILQRGAVDVAGVVDEGGDNEGGVAGVVRVQPVDEPLGGVVEGAGGDEDFAVELDGGAAVDVVARSAVGGVQGAIGEKPVATADDNASIGLEGDAVGLETGGRDEAGVRLARCGEGADLDEQDEGEDQTSDGDSQPEISGMIPEDAGTRKGKFNCTRFEMAARFDLLVQCEGEQDRRRRLLAACAAPHS